jgi:diguanylate cyclase (GGDEF)-like protein
MPGKNDAAARYRVALEEYLHDEREFEPSSCLNGDLSATDLAVDDLARVHAEALLTVIAHAPSGALSAVLLRSAMALATAVMAKSIWAPQASGFDSLSAYSAVERYLQYARSTSSPFCILLIDIDNFRVFNRTFDRKAGHEALSAIYGVVRSNCRDGDAVLRSGGDELCMILPGTHLRGGMVAAERIRSAVDACHFGRGRLTVSVGLVCFPADGSTADRLIQLAYEACHMALLLGGNGIYTPLNTSTEAPAADTNDDGDDRVAAHRDVPEDTGEEQVI